MGLFTENFSDVEEVKKGSGNAVKYIYPGIRHNVVINKVYAGKSSNKGTPFIGVELYTKEGGKDATKEMVLSYVTEATMSMLQSKIKHLAHAVVTAKELEEGIDDTSVETIASSLNDLLKGQSLRMKFTGREYLGNDNTVKSSAEIGLPPFAEATQEGAEHAVVADEDTELKYDENNQYDLKKLSPDQMPTSEDNVEESSASGIDDIV